LEICHSRRYLDGLSSLSSCANLGSVSSVPPQPQRTWWYEIAEFLVPMILSVWYWSRSSSFTATFQLAGLAVIDE
jgi:hypothetical protein